MANCFDEEMAKKFAKEMVSKLSETTTPFILDSLIGSGPLPKFKEFKKGDKIVFFRKQEGPEIQGLPPDSIYTDLRFHFKSERAEILCLPIHDLEGKLSLKCPICEMLKKWKKKKKDRKIGKKRKTYRWKRKKKY